MLPILEFIVAAAVGYFVVKGLWALAQKEINGNK